MVEKQRRRHRTEIKDQTAKTTSQTREEETKTEVGSGSEPETETEETEETEETGETKEEQSETSSLLEDEELVLEGESSENRSSTETELSGDVEELDDDAVMAGIGMAPAQEDDDGPISEGSSSYIESTDLSDSESSGYDPTIINRVGNVDLSKYDGMTHIGYDMWGDKVKKSLSLRGPGTHLDDLIARKDDPNYFRRVYDPLHDTERVLTDEEWNIVERIAKGGLFPTYQDPDYNPFAVYGQDPPLEMPLIQFRRPRESFLLPGYQMKIIEKLAKAIERGEIDPEEEKKKALNGHEKPQEAASFDLWSDEGAITTNSESKAERLKPPRIHLPGDEASYHPPPEYVGTETEDMTFGQHVIPQSYDCMRHVPANPNFVKERFYRCLDLYAKPRALVDAWKPIKADDLLPRLPDPEELRPFPERIAVIFRGHRNRVTCCAVSPNPGMYLATGSEDGTVRIWELLTGRCIRTIWVLPKGAVAKNRYSVKGGGIKALAWSPNREHSLLAVAAHKQLVLVDPGCAIPSIRAATRKFVLFAPDQADSCPGVTWECEKGRAAGQGTVSKATGLTQTQALSEGIKDREEDKQEEDKDEFESFKPKGAEEEPFTPPPSDDEEPLEDVVEYQSFSKHILGRIHHKHRIVGICWHPKGDYIAVASNGTGATSVVLHQISRHRSQTPFKKYGSEVSGVQFHPKHPVLFVATARNIRMFNLATLAAAGKFQSSAGRISSFTIHKDGEHLISGSANGKIFLHSTQIGKEAEQKLKAHTNIIRSVAVSPKYPLVACACDDGKVSIIHLRTYDDLFTPPMFVPITILKKHKKDLTGIGALCVAFHTQQPWVVTGGSDGLVYLWV